MKAITAFLKRKSDSGKSKANDAAASSSVNTSKLDTSMPPLEHMDLEMHNACARGLKKAFKYLEDNITPAHGKLIFQTSGLNTEVDQLIKLIEDDTISPLDFQRMKSLHSLGYALLKVLSRHDALIPSDLYDEFTSSNVEYEPLLRQPRKQHLGLLEFIMNTLWRLIYEKQCGVRLEQVCKTCGTVLLRPPDEGMISFDDDDIFQTPEMQLRMATFSGILRCFRVDPQPTVSQGSDRLVSSSGQGLGKGKAAMGGSSVASSTASATTAAAASVAAAAPTVASIQDRSVKLIFSDPENRPTEEELMEILTTYGEVTNIGFKNKLAVVLFAALEPALECALDNDGNALGPDIKVKYLGAKELLEQHMKTLEEMFRPAPTTAAAPTASTASMATHQQQQQQQQQQHKESPEIRPSHEETPVRQMHSAFPGEISAIHPYAGRSMADAGDHNISLNLSADSRQIRVPFDGYSSSSSNGSRNLPRPATAPSAQSTSQDSHGSGWKTAQRPTSREMDRDSHSSGDSGGGTQRPQTAPPAPTVTATTPARAKRSKAGIADVEGRESPRDPHHQPAGHDRKERKKSPLRVQTTSGREGGGVAGDDSSDNEGERGGVNYSTLVSPPSSGGSLRRQRQIKKIHVGSSPTAASQTDSPFSPKLNDYRRDDDDDASYLEEYASPTLTRPIHRDDEDDDDGHVLMSTKEFQPPEGFGHGGTGSGKHSSSTGGSLDQQQPTSRSSRRYSQRSGTSSTGSSAPSSRRPSSSSLLHGGDDAVEHFPHHRTQKPITADAAAATDEEVDIVNYFAQKIAQSMDRTHRMHHTTDGGQSVALSQEYTGVKALFEVAEREYQDQIKALEAKCVVYHEKIAQQETWLTAIEQRWQAELLQKQIHVSTLETDNRQLREEIQALKMEVQSKNARIAGLESSAETMNRAVKMSKDRAQRDSLSVVLSQQQVITSLDENLEAIKGQNIRLQDEIDTLTMKYHGLIGENLQWKSKVAEWELKWQQRSDVDAPTEEGKRETTAPPATTNQQPLAIVDEEKQHGKYFEGILVAAGKQALVGTTPTNTDGVAADEDKEYRTMRALADHEVEEYMNHLPGRYHPVYSRDTVGIIRADTRHASPLSKKNGSPSPTRGTTGSSVPPAAGGGDSDRGATAGGASSSPPKYLRVKFDDQTENMTYSERLLANMSKHYRAGYHHQRDGDLFARRSRSPSERSGAAAASSSSASSSSTSYHPYYHHQPTRSAAITAAHMLPAAAEILPPPPAGTSHIAKSATTQQTTMLPPTSTTKTNPLLPSSVLDSPMPSRDVDSSHFSPSALQGPPSAGGALSRPVSSLRQSAAARDDPMVAIRNYLAEKQLASSRADLGESMSGMRFYSHLRSQFENIDIPTTTTRGNGPLLSTVPSTTTTSYNSSLRGYAEPKSKIGGVPAAVKEDELWKLYV